MATPADVYNYYPHAFSANLINDVDAGTLAQYTSQLTAAVKRGDVLMVHADYWQANNPTVVAIYQQAGVTGPQPTSPPPPPPPPPPTAVAIAITTPASGQTLSGTISVTGEINPTLDSAGSYLMVDGNEVGTARLTGPPYVYGLNTTTLSNGAHTLQLWAHDISNDTLLSATVTATVSNSGNSSSPPPPAPSSYPIALTSPASGQSVSGTISVTATITETLDSAGSFLMVDGQAVGTTRVTSAPYVYQLNANTLSAGQHSLQIWAHDINNDTLLSNPVVITVP